MLRLALLMTLAMPLPALAQGACAGIADTAATLLKEGWREHSGGLMDGATVTIYTHSNGRWVAILVTRDQACIVATGTAWAETKPNA